VPSENNNFWGSVQQINSFTDQPSPKLAYGKLGKCRPDFQSRNLMLWHPFHDPLITQTVDMLWQTCMAGRWDRRREKDQNWQLE